MTSIDMHPEELLDALRIRVLSDGESQRLLAHCAKCTACKLETQLIQARGVEPPLEDSILEAVMAELAADPPTIHSVPQRRSTGRRSMRRVMLVAAATLALASTVAAMVAGYRVVTETPEKAAPAVPRRARVVQVHVEPDAAVDASVPEVDATSVATPERNRAPRTAPPTPSALFSEATGLQRDGDHRAALRAYRQLLRLHPTSRQSAVAKVKAGNLYLSRLRQPRSALRLFSGYLQFAPQGALAEEARLGRAVSLERLGRAGAERTAWEELLRRHPGSVHAARAKKRLSELNTSE